VILLVLAGAWLTGLAAAAAGFHDAHLFALPLGAGTTAGFLVTRRDSTALLAVLAFALFALGSLRLQAALPDNDASGLAAQNDGPGVTLRGVVDREPERRDSSQQLTLRVDSVRDGDAWRPLAGKVLITARPFPRFEYGDRLEVAANLDSPPVFESFDYRRYLALRGIASTAAFPEVTRLGAGSGSRLTEALIDFRNRLGDALSAALPEPEAALSRGMLLGQRTSIPEDLNDDFNRAGISHLIAISGSNVTIVAEVVVASLAWLLGRRRAVLAAMLFIGGFVLLVGASPSVLRAGIMGGLLLGAVVAGRPGSALTAVAVAAAVLTAWQPLAVLDVSFQLSFAATLGLILIEPHLRARLNDLTSVNAWVRLPAFAVETISVTTAASLAVFPITAANFERVSLIAIPANIVAVPLFTSTLVLSAVASAFGLLSPVAGHLAGVFAYVPLRLLIETARFFASLPLASIDVADVGTVAAAALYLAIALGVAWLWRRRTEARELTPARPRLGVTAVAVAITLAAAAFVWADVLSGDSGHLRVTILDVGQGDSILVQTPRGQRILIDGGPSGPVLLRDLSRELPGGDRRIDLLVLTHPQEDHVAGLVEVMDQYRVRTVAVSGKTNEIGSFEAWEAALDLRGLRPTTVLFGEEADLGGGVGLEVLSPSLPYLSGTADDFNNNAVVLRLSYGSVSFMLTADLGTEGEERLLSETGRLGATVLKVGHHGSETSTTRAFLDAVHPAVAVISAGEGNPYGHPSPGTLLRLAGIPVYRTDRNGPVRFETDGSQLFLKPDHGQYQLVPVSAR
jgi:competence protein ComEC